MSDSTPLNHPLPATAVSWLPRDLLLFANSIGLTTPSALQYLYELHPSFSAFPTYPIILSFKHTDQDVVDFYDRSNKSAFTVPGVPKMDPRRIVDGQRKITVLKKLPTKGEVGEWELRGKVVGVWDKGKSGSVTEVENTLVNKKTGEEYVKIESSSFAVGQGGWGGPKGPKGVNYPPPSGKAPDAVFDFQTTPQTALLYRLNGDYNPLHADPTIGPKMGFKGAILHGLCTWNIAAQGVLEKFGGMDPEALKVFQARFASPVMPGDRLKVEMWKVGKVRGDDEGVKGEGELEEVRFVCKVVEEGGKERVVLSNGRALVKSEKGRSKL